MNEQWGEKGCLRMSGTRRSGHVHLHTYTPQQEPGASIAAHPAIDWWTQRNKRENRVIMRVMDGDNPRGFHDSYTSQF